jgi:hypothetical protein
MAKMLSETRTQLNCGLTYVCFAMQALRGTFILRGNIAFNMTELVSIDEEDCMSIFLRLAIFLKPAFQRE